MLEPSYKTITQQAVTDKDGDFLINLYLTTREKELEALQHCTDHQKQLFIKQQYNSQYHHYTHNYPAANLNVLIAGGQRIGRLYVHRTDKHIQLMDIILMPSMRNQGIGTYLVSQLIEEAKKNVCSLGLHVELFNPARNFYEKLGFSVQENLEFYHCMQWQSSACSSAHL